MPAVSCSTSSYLAQGSSNSCIPGVSAVQHVRRMRGGAQSHLMRCSDGKLYVVKFLNNPQHSRVFANEILATGLAEFARLPVSHMALVQVDALLIEQTPELTMSLMDKNF